MVGRIRHNLQEHLKQVESFLQLVEACSKHADAIESAKSQASQVSPGEETRQTPNVKPLEDSNLKAIVVSWLSQQPVFTAEPLESLEPRPSWDRAPEFWQDLLADDLWKVFADVHKEKLSTQGMTEQTLELESKDPGLCGSKTDGDSEGILSHPAPNLAEPLSSSRGALQEETSAPQEPARYDCQLLKLFSWDPEDLEDSWKRPGGSLWPWQRSVVPHALQSMCVLKQGELVLDAAVSSFSRHAFTCSRGGIKVWSLVGQVAKDRFPESHLQPSVQAPGAYLRTCLLSSDSRSLLAGGHNLPSVSVWDLAAPSLYEKQQLPCEGLSCQALASSVDESLAFAGFSDGTVRVWDMRSQKVVRDLFSHISGVKSLVVNDHNLWTGGLDACLRCWDLRVVQDPLEYMFESQIMSLSHSPQEDYLLLGMANGQHWLHSMDTPKQRLMVASKDKTVLGVKFSPDGQWFVSVGMDDLVSIHSMPTGAKVFQVCEATSIMCCDVSSNGRLIITGSGNHASVYQVTY
uniref:transducin-like enhancer protein 6 isoform X2 n=1 Tax=Jaculus jaculus TaxID=51337 RepID=UPI001E1B40B2|nr:transducin-like enhancer protein 6 isoform X2 [Jaculus jaculus]